MKINIRSIAIAALLVAVSFTFVLQGNSREPAFTAVHFFNLQPPDKARLLSIFQEFNQLFTTLGYPNVQYRLWKFTEGDTMGYSHRWDSVWPNRVVYDKIHEDENYKKLVEKHRTYLEETLKAQAYYRFIELIPVIEKK